MKALLFVAILVVYSYAQERPPGPGGCCFYAGKQFKDEIACSSQSFRITQTVQSWFCTPGFAANLVKQKAILAPVLCGDTLPETSRPVDPDEVHIFTPCPRFSDCCFYTEDGMRGEESCIPGTAPADGKLFKSYTCLPGWKPKIKGGADLICQRPGVAFSLPAPAKYTDLETTACEIQAIPDEPLAATVFEAGTAFSDLDSNFNGDAASATLAEDTNFAIQTASDGAPVEDFVVNADTESLALQGDAAFATEDVNFVDAAFATEDVNFVEGDNAAFATFEEAAFVEGDQGVAGADQSVQSGAASVSAMICLLVGVISLLLA